MSIPSRFKALRYNPTTLSSRFPAVGTALEALTLFILTAFFLFYGLVPIFGGAGIGLVGADEPRYAQVAREMLQRRDFITPYLWGKPWLEKPALYYWRAMYSYREFGIHDWTARLPSATFAFVLVVMIYLHIRRFRRGGQLDAALITASCAGIIAFARGASTDMQLAAPFCIGMLGWYAWYETDSKFWLFDLYFFGGAATLAKGPVAPFLALCILIIFAALRREWSMLRRTLWWPGICLYLAMVLPWFVEVQIRNPSFLKTFFLQHNLERFASNRFHHEQIFWYYLPVVLLAITPWAVIAIAAFVDAIKQAVTEWSVRRAKYHYPGTFRPGDAFPEFLVLWALIPIVFFSFSQSKLPGYILPSVPPLTILAGDYLNRLRERGRDLKSWLLILHAVLTGILTMFVVLLPLHLQHPESIPPTNAIIAGGMTGFAAAVFILIVVYRFGLKRLRIATMTPMIIMLLFIVGVGPFLGIPAPASTKRNITLINLTYSARPLYQIISKITSPGEPVAVYDVRRDVEFGLSFYRDKRVDDYERDGIPDARHILVIREAAIGRLSEMLKGRTYEPLFAYPAQDLIVYSVAARGQ
ncbi:MAG: ArnT family glycosyltransferase [Acidobacteriaceae bacterium]